MKRRFFAVEDIPRFLLLSGRGKSLRHVYVVVDVGVVDFNVDDVVIIVV